MLLHKSAGGRAVLSSSVISRRFKHVLSDLPHDYRALGRAVISSSVISRRFKHVLPDFPYDYGALEPVISAEIMRLHHQKHHATLQKGDVRAAVTLQRGLKINRDFKSVRCFSSEGDKQDPPRIAQFKRKLVKFWKDWELMFYMPVFLCSVFIGLVLSDIASAVKRDKTSRMQREKESQN